MELTLTEGCLIEFCMQLIRVICQDSYYSLFYYPSYKQVQRLTPSNAQAIPLYCKQNYHVMDLRANFTTACFNQFCWNVTNTW